MNFKKRNAITPKVSFQTAVDGAIGLQSNPASAPVSSMENAGKHTSSSADHPQQTFLENLRIRLNSRGDEIVTVGALFYLSGLCMSDMLYLRSLAVCSSICSITFNLTRDTPFKLSAMWGSVFMCVNLLMIAKLIFERQDVLFTGEDLQIYETWFLSQGLTPRQFYRLLRMGEIRDIPRNSPIVSQNAGRKQRNLPLPADGSHPHDIVFVLRGEVDITNIQPGSDSKSSVRLVGGQPGAVLGARSFLESQQQWANSQGKTRSSNSNTATNSTINVSLIPATETSLENGREGDSSNSSDIKISRNRVDSSNIQPPVVSPPSSMTLSNSGTKTGSDLEDTKLTVPLIRAKEHEKTENSLEKNALNVKNIISEKNSGQTEDNTASDHQSSLLKTNETQSNKISDLLIKDSNNAAVSERDIANIGQSFMENKDKLNIEESLRETEKNSSFGLLNNRLEVSGAKPLLLEKTEKSSANGEFEDGDDDEEDDLIVDSKGRLRTSDEQLDLPLHGNLSTSDPNNFLNNHNYNNLEKKSSRIHDATHSSSDWMMPLAKGVFDAHRHKTGQDLFAEKCEEVRTEVDASLRFADYGGHPFSDEDMYIRTPEDDEVDTDEASKLAVAPILYIPRKAVAASDNVRVLIIPGEKAREWACKDLLFALPFTRALAAALVARVRSQSSETQKGTYFEMLRVCVQDGIISPGERDALKVFKTRQGISDEYHLEALGLLGWSNEEFLTGHRSYDHLFSLNNVSKWFLSKFTPDGGHSHENREPPQTWQPHSTGHPAPFN